MKIYTRTGDAGETGLFGGGRVSKNHPRVVAYGDVDELNATIGWMAAIPPEAFEQNLFEAIQRDLFAIGGQLATPNRSKVEASLEKATLPGQRVAEFEAAIDRADDQLPPLKAFVLPGGTPKAAALHVSRTVCRRAERSIVALAMTEEVNPEILVYLNRLSDLLFVMARHANHSAGISDRTW